MSGDKFEIQKYKLAIIGCGGVGKSSLHFRFVQSYFSECANILTDDVYLKQCVIDGRIVHMDSKCNIHEISRYLPTFAFSSNKCSYMKLAKMLVRKS